MSTICAHCHDVPTSNGLVWCGKCQKTAKRAIENVAAYHGDLLSLGAQRVVTRKASGFSDPTGSAASAAEYDDSNAPDVAAYETKAQLVGWIRSLVEDRPQVAMPRDTVESMAAVLAKRTTTIATLPWADAYIHGVLALERRLLKIVQRSKGHWYAGVCWAEIVAPKDHDHTTCVCGCHLDLETCDIEGGDCGPEEKIAGEYCAHELYAIPGTTHVRCPQCRTNHSVQARRTVLLDEARETLLPPSTIAQVCVTLLEGEPSVERMVKRIDNWIRRGQLNDYGVRVLDDRRAHRVYRLGDVLDTLIADASKSKRGASC